MKSATEITLSICCITYNHEKFIAQCLDSFLMQETNFRYEIIVGEDCSTDDTRNIVESNRQKHPDKFKVITDVKNVGAQNNLIRVLTAARGKYIALCDGDDFWIDRQKIQKQVDFLENNLSYTMCCAYTRVINNSGKVVYQAEKLVPREYSYNDLMAGKREETRISSAVMRNSSVIGKMFKTDWYLKSYGTDVFIRLYLTANTGGKIFVLPEIMNCYRHHTGGIYSMADPRKRKRQMLNDFILMIHNFEYPGFIKKQLLRKYLSEYFFFELRDLKLARACSTIVSLL